MRGCVGVGRLLVLLWLLALPCVPQVRHPLPVLWMMPLSAPPGLGNLTAAVVPAVQLALQDLRRQPAPLGSYDVQFHLLDSQCDGAAGLKALFDAMWSGPGYLLLFGGVCPAVTTLVAQSLPALNLVQLSFAATSPVLANRDRYPNLFSVVPSEGTVNQAVMKTLLYYKWSRVGILTQDMQRFSEMKTDLMKRLRKADVQVAATERLSRDPCVNLKNLKDKDIRIIIGQFEEDSASEVFCCAYRLNMFGRRYQWVLASQSKARWWLDFPASGCTSNSLQTAMEGAIFLDIQRLSDRHVKGISGRTPQEYNKAYLSELMRDRTRGSLLHSFAYDGVWAVATALSQVVEAVKHREKYSIHYNFTISSKKAGQMLLEAMKRTQFEGVTGRVLFRNGERMTWIELSQFQGGREVVVGKYDSYTQQLRVIHHRIQFKGGSPARDQAAVRLQQLHISVVLYSIVSFASMLVLITVLMVLCFTIKNHQHRLLKASGPSMDCLLILSMLLTCSSIFLFGLDGALVSDQVFEVICSVRLWVLSVGHTVGFAALFAKTWTVFSIYTNNGTHEKKRSWAHKPHTVVAGMLVLDVAVLSFRQVLDPLRRAVFCHSLEAGPNDKDITVHTFSEHCDSANMDLWLSIVYGYKGPLLGLGCFLAWNIRQVPDGHPLSATSRLALSMCAVTLSCSLGAAGSLLTDRQPSSQFCLTALAVLFCNASVLVLLFGPKLLDIRANQGNAVERTCEFQCGAEEEAAQGELEDGCSQQDQSGAQGELEDGCSQQDQCGAEGELEDGCSQQDQCGAQGKLEDDCSQQDQCGLERLHSQKHHLRRRIIQLDVELETVAMQLYEMSALSSADTTDRYVSTFLNNDKAGEERWLLRRLVHEAQICPEDRAASGMKPVRTEDVNSPEHVRRRLSLQLPILHHAYLPAVGGVTASCSSLTGSPEAIFQHTQMIQLHSSFVSGK